MMPLPDLGVHPSCPVPGRGRSVLARSAIGILTLLASILGGGEPCANQVGLAVLVTPAGPERAVSLARAGWMVQALADDAGCQALRQAGEAAGVLGRTLWVGRWNGTIPIADQTADLVEGPAPIAAEARRVLIPGLGAASLGGGILRVPRPPTWDAWSHWLHGADNNPVSADSAFALPARLAWLGRPFHVERSAAGRVAADGRLFLATGVGNFGQPLPGTCELSARSLHNGTLLWRRELPKGVRTARSSMLALGGNLLVLEGGAVLRLEGASGTELGRHLVAEGRELKWMGAEGGALVVLAGTPDVPSRGFFGDLAGKSKGLEEGGLGHGDELICLDAVQGLVRWRVKAPALIDSRAVAISAGMLVYHAPRSRIAALDLASGAERWVQADPQVLALAGGTRTSNLSVGLEDRPGLVANGKVVLLALPDVKRMVTLSQADGAMLWQLECGYGVAPSELIVGDRVFCNAHGGAAFDARTGAKTKIPFWPVGCGIITASNSLLFSNTFGPRYDLLANSALPGLSMKSQCQVGTCIADGRVIASATSCLCGITLGHCVLASALGTLPEASGQDRLILGRTGVDLAATPIAGDWPTHRADIRRSGYAPVEIPKLRQLWQAKPAHPFPVSARGPFSDEPDWRCLPPVCLGDLVVVAASDGSVRAFQAGSGTPRWTFWCEGPVLAAPTIAGGRVYVGSADGSVVCLAVSDGALRWRFRAAPEERRIPVYGLLQSPWPVNSGVLVDGGTAYVVAGMAMSPPTTVYALDAATGTPRWAQRGDWNPNGGLALIGQRLWLRTFHKPGPAIRLSLTDGTRDPDAIEISGMRGREVAQVAPDLVLYGGPDAYRDVGNPHASRSEGMAAVRLDGEGRPRLPGIVAMLYALVAPAGDGDLAVIVGTQPPGGGAGGPGDEQLEGWDVERTRSEVDALTAAIDLAKMPPHRLGALPQARTDAQYAASPQRRWGPLPLTVRGLALARNAVVAVAAGRATTVAPRGPWKLLILDRATGATIQELDLPEEPAADGLCLTRGGGVVVALRGGGVVAYGGMEAR